MACSQAVRAKPIDEGSRCFIDGPSLRNRRTAAVGSHRQERRLRRLAQGPGSGCAARDAVTADCADAVATRRFGLEQRRPLFLPAPASNSRRGDTEAGGVNVRERIPRQTVQTTAGHAAVGGRAQRQRGSGPEVAMPRLRPSLSVSVQSFSCIYVWSACVRTCIHRLDLPASFISLPILLTYSRWTTIPATP